MKLTGNDIVNYFGALNNIMNKTMSGKLAIAVFSNIKTIEPHNDVVVSAIHKVNEQHIEDKNKLGEEFKTISEQEFDVADFKKVDASEFDCCKDITPADIYRLQFMIK